MKIEVSIVEQPIVVSDCDALDDCGAVLEFRGVVRGEESGAPISGLVYEAYQPMAETEMQRILGELSGEHSCLRVRVIHRIGRIPAGEVAIHVWVWSRHRKAAIHLLDVFMDQLKQNVPIWKTGTY